MPDYVTIPVNALTYLHKAHIYKYTHPLKTLLYHSITSFLLGINQVLKLAEGSCDLKPEEKSSWLWHTHQRPAVVLWCSVRSGSEEHHGELDEFQQLFELQVDPQGV